MESTPVLWNTLFKSILAICVLGFLSGVGMLHGQVLLGLIALLLTVLLAAVMLFAVGVSLWSFRKLGVFRLLAVLALPPAAWYGTIAMVDEYPGYKIRTTFLARAAEYREAVEIARKEAANSESLDLTLPERMSSLAADGHLLVYDESGDIRCYAFRTFDNFFAGSYRSIVYAESKDAKPLTAAQEEPFGEKLAPGWYVSSEAD